MPVAGSCQPLAIRYALRWRAIVALRRQATLQRLWAHWLCEHEVEEPVDVSVVERSVQHYFEVLAEGSYTPDPRLICLIVECLYHACCHAGDQGFSWGGERLHHDFSTGAWAAELRLSGLDERQVQHRVHLRLLRSLPVWLLEYVAVVVSPHFERAVLKDLRQSSGEHVGFS